LASGLHAGRAKIKIGNDEKNIKKSQGMLRVQGLRIDVLFS